MYYLPPTLISILEVLLVIVPALLSVAYVTVAERKTMASMQRRLGPNHTGFNLNTGVLRRNGLCIDYTFTNYPFTNYINTFYVRQLHTSNYYLSNNQILLDSLLDSRLAPVIPFTHPTLITCADILNQTEKNEFFSKPRAALAVQSTSALSDLIIEKKDNDLGVIYIFQSKHDPNIFYIGRTNSLRTRLINHLSKYKFDKFHVISRNLG